MGTTLSSRSRSVGRWIFGILFILAGIGHFARPEMYMKIMPDYLPYHRELVLISGAFESALGLMLLIPTTRRLAAWGLIALLIAIFPANLDMFLHPEKSGLSPVALAIRLPIQGLLILWAWAYTGPERPTDDRP
ncbi:DoxX family membrane protein [Isosphaeraceae bacterium EP7]